jgi:shikimate dehydrogenase
MRALPGRLVLLGHPVAHSLSPTFQNAALSAAAIPLKYEAVDVPPQSLAATLATARANDWAGNVTVPHKETVFAACTELTPVAERVGAVNTFRARGGSLIGHNTDVRGVRAAIAKLMGDEPRDAVIGVVGAGGAAAAVLAAVEEMPGCRALVTNRSGDRRRDLVGRFRSIARESDAGTVARESDIVVNATSLGLRDDDPAAIDVQLLRPGSAVLDLVYSPAETRLVRDARAAGFRAADGLAMLVEQGAAAFGWWFSIAPDIGVMWKSLGGTPRAAR